MAAGLPVVAPGSDGILTYANPTNAWLAEPSAAGFAEAIASVQSNPENRLQKVERALCTARNYSWPLVTPNFFQLYDQFCEPTRKLDAKVAAVRTKSAAA
jgi:glycosyltransferase involved in cell wall biosynthesis